MALDSPVAPSTPAQRGPQTKPSALTPAAQKHLHANVRAPPKRAKSPYMFFYKQTYPQLKADAKFDKLKITEIAKAIGARWAALDADQKAVFIQAAADDKTRWENERAEFLKDPDAVAAEKDKKRRARARRELRRTARNIELGLADVPVKPKKSRAKKEKAAEDGKEKPAKRGGKGDKPEKPAKSAKSAKTDKPAAKGGKKRAAGEDDAKPKAKKAKVAHDE